MAMEKKFCLNLTFGRFLAEKDLNFIEQVTLDIIRYPISYVIFLLYIYIFTDVSNYVNECKPPSRSFRSRNQSRNGYQRNRVRNWKKKLDIYSRLKLVQLMFYVIFRSEFKILSQKVADLEKFAEVTFK